MHLRSSWRHDVLLLGLANRVVLIELTHARLINIPIWRLHLRHIVETSCSGISKIVTFGQFFEKARRTRCIHFQFRFSGTNNIITLKKVEDLANYPIDDRL